MTQEQIDPVKVEVTNHPQPKRYELRHSYLTVQLNVSQPFYELGGYDPLRKYIRISGCNTELILCGSMSQAQSTVNASTAPGSRPDGRLIPATTLEAITEGTNEVWVTTGTSNLPLNIGYEIVREVPE